MLNTAIIEEINNALGANAIWKMRLRGAIKDGHCETTAACACQDNQCAFGKWLYGPTIDPVTKAGTPYQVVKRLHAEFHRTAGSILAYVERGDPASALSAMTGEYQHRSDRLVQALNKWKNEVAGQPRSSAA